MWKKYIVTCNEHKQCGSFDVKEIVVDGDYRPLSALIQAQNQLCDSFSEDWYISRNCQEINLSLDGEDVIITYADFTVREIGCTYGYIVQYVIDCATSNDTIALVKHPNMVCEDVAREEFYAMMEETNNG